MAVYPVAPETATVVAPANLQEAREKFAALPLSPDVQDRLPNAPPTEHRLLYPVAMLTVPALAPITLLAN